MNLILIISFCAALTIYLDADKSDIKPLKWCLIAFASCYITYYLVFSAVLLVVMVTEYQPNKIVHIALSIFIYAIAMLTIMPVSIAMKKSKSRESANQLTKADEMTAGDSR